MEILFVKLFVFSYFLNFFWEAWHSELYTTCHRMKYTDRMRLLTLMSLKDAFWICVFFGATVLAWGSVNIFQNPAQVATFVVLALGFSFIDERVSLRHGRWEYAPSMPCVFGVGITPLVELAVTGVIAITAVLYR